MTEQTRTPEVTSAEELALMIDAVQDYAFFMLSPDGTIRSWNAGAQRIFGYSADEAIGQTFRLFYPPEELAVRKPENELQIASTTGRVEDTGVRKRKNGELFRVNTVITALRGADGELRGFAKVTRDLTERRHAHEQLRQSEEIFRLLVSAVQDYAMFVLSPEGVIRSWNSGAERIFGYTAEEAVGKNFTTFYPPDAMEARKPQRELQTAMEHGRVEDEGWRVRKNGGSFWVNTVITALRDDNGLVQGFAKVTRDLTERREAEEQLREREEMFRLIVTSVQEYAIFMLDPLGNVMTWNEGARRIKGYEPQEIIGQHFSTFYPDEDKWKAARELDVATREGIVKDEGWRLRKDGRRFWANVVLTAIHDREGRLRGFTKVTRDMTERREAELTRQALLEQREARLVAEEERRRAEASYRAAQEANRMRDEFLMTLSHELRTPMTSIVGWSRLLMDMKPGDPMLRDAVQAIARNAQHQSRLIEDVLDVSRIVSGKMRLIVDTVEVVPLLQGSLETVRTAADAKRITLETSFAPDLGRVVLDPVRFQQIIWNLLTNAVKFTPKGGVVRLTARRTSSQLDVRVSDNGSGIEPDFLPHVFEPFRQAESSTTRSHGGLGLGLSIVRYLVEAHGGSVSASSSGKGEGSIFTVVLPIRPVAVNESAVVEASRDEEPTMPQESAALDGISILIVDDDDEGRIFIRATLIRAGATVEDAGSVAGARQRLDARDFDVIITDVAMPEIDGLAFASEIRQSERTANVGLIALTAFSSLTKAPPEAFDRFLTKPIDPSDLTHAVREVYDRRHSDEE